MGLAYPLPTVFLESISPILGEEIDDFIAALNSEPPTSIRFNRGKAGTDPGRDLESIPWSDNGFYLPSRPSFIEDPGFFQGRYYVQEASSMVIGNIAKRLARKQRISKVLDLCAAPGGKSTDLLSSLPDLNLLVSNELVQKRVHALTENVVKWGHPNCIICHTKPESFSILSEEFDLILIDAPCSGEGMFRKDPRALAQWTSGLRAKCAITQKKIVNQAWNSLKTGGYLIYSTCTLNREENEEVIKVQARTHELKTIELQGLEQFGILQEKWKCETRAGFTYRFLPHRTKGEGFTLTLVQKLAGQKDRNRRVKKLKPQFGWIPERFSGRLELSIPEKEGLVKNQGRIFMLTSEMRSFMDRYGEFLNYQSPGLEIGRLSPKGLIPSHEISMKIGFDHPSKYELNSEQCLKFLRRIGIPLDSKLEGWVLIIHNNLPLGWGKIQNGLLKSHFPKEYKIRKPAD
jgi:16S rRNA C967 or C1407 C5-methylase (RsmB/RsmF family)/NOL1/NOP2/fmu family ribosome biogenesis protein